MKSQAISDIEFNKCLINGITGLIELLNSMPEDEALSKLRRSQDETLLWLLNDIAIPGGEFYIVSLVKDILKERGILY